MNSKAAPPAWGSVGGGLQSGAAAAAVAAVAAAKNSSMHKPSQAEEHFLSGVHRTVATAYSSKVMSNGFQIQSKLADFGIL